MSYMLPHLTTGWAVDQVNLACVCVILNHGSRSALARGLRNMLCRQAILSEEDRVICVRFGHDWDIDCMKMDECLYKMAEKARAHAAPPFSPFATRH